MHKNYHVYSQKEMLLHAMVGRVVSKWASLENQLLDLASWGLRMNLHKTAKLTSAFKTFALSLDFTQSVCAARVKDDVFLNSLVDYIRELSGDRNFIAHTQVVAHGRGDPAKADWTHTEPFVGPAMKEYFAEVPQKREAMDAAEVREIAEDIQHAISLTMDFARALKAGGTWPDKFYKPVAPRRPRLAQRRAENDKAPKGPPKSVRVRSQGGYKRRDLSPRKKKS
jgi:hypothetical protein